MRLKTLLSIVAVSGVHAGCQTPKAARDLALTQAGVLNAYRTSAQAVAAQRGRLDADTERRLDELGDLRAHNDAYVAQRLTGFTVSGDKAAAEIYATLSARSAADVLGKSASLAALFPPPAAPKVAFDPAEINALVKALRAAGEKPSDRKTLTEAFAYAKDVKAAYEASLTEAEKTAKTAEGAGGSANTAAAKALAVDLTKGSK
jgi:hypothetical protein